MTRTTTRRLTEHAQMYLDMAQTVPDPGKVHLEILSGLLRDAADEIEVRDRALLMFAAGDEPLVRRHIDAARAELAKRNG